MIRLKLFIGLFSAVLVLAAAGAIGMGFLKIRITEFEETFSREYAAIRAFNDIRSMAQSLNAHYIPLFAESTDYTEIETDFLDERIGKILSLLEELDTEPPIEILSEEKVDEIRGEVIAYEEEIKDTIRANDPEDILQTRREILEKSLSVFEISGSVIEQLERDLAEKHNLLRDSSADTFVALGIIAGMSIVLAIFAYQSLTKGILGPVTHLTDSIREVQKRNLDLRIPVRSRDELGDLNDAFNMMAAELRVVSLEHDEKVKKVDAENQAIIRNFPHPIAFLDTEGSVVKLNPKAKDLFSKIELRDGLPTRVRTLVRQAIEKQEDFVPQELFNSMLLRVEERETFYLPRIFQIHEDAGFDGWAVVLTDVTKLRWIDDIKNNFLATVSHEIRTPLTSVRMVLHLLAEQKAGQLQERQLEMVLSAKEETDRLVGTISQLLSTSRIESGDEYLATKLFKPSKLLKNALGDLSLFYEENQHELIVECEEDLPKIMVDEAGIKLVFQNYLSNAIRFSPEGEPITVRVGKWSDQFVRFSVIDSGEGVPNELGEAVFEKFVRAETAEETGVETGAKAVAGVGLGLSISREIVRAHGGRVGLEREDNCTIFYFDLPIS